MGAIGSTVSGHCRASTPPLRLGQVGLFRSTLAQAVEALNLTLKGSERLHLPEKVMSGMLSSRSAICPPFGRLAHRAPSESHGHLVPQRRLTPSQGGELLLYPSGSEESVRVDPRLGRMILFRSHIEHEVCATLGARWAITAWLSTAKSPPTAPDIVQLAA